MTEEKGKEEGKIKKIIYRGYEGWSRDFEERLSAAFRQTELVQQMDQLGELLPEWIKALDTARQYADKIKDTLGGPQVEMIVALAKRAEQDEITREILDNLANGVMVWQNAPLLQSVDDRSLGRILELMEPETIENAVKAADDRTREKVKSSVERAIMHLEGDRGKHGEGKEE